MTSWSRVAGLGGIVALVGLTTGQSAFANDSTAVMGAGGITLTVSKDVVMESEDLWISSDLVRVSYRFRNTGSEDVQTTVAFPVPGIPLCDECAGDLPIQDGANPMSFKLKIDGKPKTFKTSRKKVRARDYTEMQITHYWDQNFPRDRVVTIEHEYEPGAGGSTMGGAPSTKEAAEELVKIYARELKEYCLGEKLLRGLLKDARERRYSEVHYILTTGANWKGPIGHFRLTLAKATPRELISICIPDTRRVSDTTFEVTRENFIPKEDLQILFIREPNR